MTIWKPVGFGFSDLYEVSSKGEVRRIGTDTVIGHKLRNGYVRVQFSRNGSIAAHTVHSIVADAFIGPRPPGYHIDHANGIRDDNRLVNLRYCTPKENIGFTKDRGANAVGERNGASVLTDEQVEMIRRLKAERGRYWGAAKIAAELGVGQSTVCQAARGYRYGHIPLAEEIKTGSGVGGYAIAAAIRGGRS